MATFTQSQNPWPWATGILQKEIPSKPSHGNRSHSGSTSSAGSDKIRIIDLTQHEALMKKEMSYQERYLSSEEDLSPLDEEFDDSESFKSFDYEAEDSEDLDQDIETAVHAYSDEAENPWKEEMAARVISIIYSGRPNVVDIQATPTTSPIMSQPPTREISLEKAGNNRVRPRPILQHNRVARLSSCAFADFTIPEADKVSINSQSQRSERRHSSIYSQANPPSPRFFNPLRRNSIADRTSLISEPPMLGAPAVPTLPTSNGELKSRHSRMKSLSRMAFFKKDKKERKDSLTSASMLQLPTTAPPPPLQTAPQLPPILYRSATTFAPPPYIRPLGGLVARGASEREDPAWQSMVDRQVRQYDAYGDDEMSDDESIQERDPVVTAKIRKRRSLLGLNY